MAVEEDLVWYLAWRSSDYGTPVTKTRLVKYLYLVDLLASREARKPLTRLTWTFFHYGPYTMELDRLIETERGLGHVRTRELGPRPDERAAVLVLAEYPPPEERLPRRARMLCDEVCSRWADSELNQLLNFVYFETPPMRDAERGDDLDLLSHIDERWPTRSRTTPLAAPEISEEARQRLQAAMDSRRREPRRRLGTEATYDDGYRELLRRADAADELDLDGLSGSLTFVDESGDEQ